jgi:glycosyltransferase involved in cell wall biosynthesis
MAIENKMHVLHIIENLDRGGMETFVCDLVKVQRLDARVSVICLFSGGVLAENLIRLGIHPVYCEKGKDGSVKALLRLRNQIAQLSPDVIHTHNELSNYFVLISLMLAKRPLLINTRHNMGLGGPQSRKEKLFLWSLRKTRVMVACSNAVRNRFETVFKVRKEKLRVIHNGIPFEKLQLKNHPEIRSRWRLKNQFSEQDVLICTVGRITSVKNHKGLIEAFAKIQSRNCKLVIVGDGDLRPSLEVLSSELGVRDRIVFLGDSSEVASILAATDIFALPSFSEAHSIALLEAAASGIAVVVTNVGGNPEVVVNGESGFIVEPGDLVGLSERINQLVQNAELRAQFSQRLLAWANENASIEACAKKYEMLYLENYVE